MIVLADGDGVGRECAFAYAREEVTCFITGCILPVSGSAELGYRR